MGQPSPAHPIPGLATLNQSKVDSIALGITRLAKCEKSCALHKNDTTTQKDKRNEAELTMIGVLLLGASGPLYHLTQRPLKIGRLNNPPWTNRKAHMTHHLISPRLI